MGVVRAVRDRGDLVGTPGRGSHRFLRGSVAALLLTTSLSGAIRGDEIPPPPPPLQVTVTVVRPQLPPPPPPLAVSVTVTRPQLPAPPAPLAVEVTVERPELPDPPAPLAVEVTVDRPELPPPPTPLNVEVTVERPELPTLAPFPVRVTVVRPEAPPPPAAFPVRVTVVRQGPPPPPVAFSVQVTVARQPMPPPPGAFPVQVTVVRQSMPTPPGAFPVQVTVIRQPMPPPPGAFAVQVTVARPDPTGEIADLLEELRRLEAESAIEAEAATQAADQIDFTLEGLSVELRAMQTRLETLREAIAAATNIVPEVERLYTEIEDAERSVAEPLAGVITVAEEVCEASRGTTELSASTSAALATKVDRADATADDMSIDSERCGRLLNDLFAAISDWEATWVAASRGGSAEVGPALERIAASLSDERERLADLATAGVRLNEIEVAARPVISEIETHTANWLASGWTEIHDEVTGEVNELAQKIESRSEQAAERHDHLGGKIETFENDLEIARNDLTAVDQDYTDIDTGLRSELATVLSDSRAANDRATAAEADAGDAVTSAYGCLDRLPQESETESLEILMPDLFGRSERMATAWLLDLGVFPIVRIEQAASTPDKSRTVVAQSIPPDTPMAPETAVTLTVLDDYVERTLTQADCDVRRPGSQLTPLADGSLDCLCPTDSAWSLVQGRCLELPGAGNTPGGSTSRDCSHMAGTLWDSNLGRCRCPVGDWNSDTGCVDTAAVDREREVQETIKGAECENLYSRIQVFRGRSDSIGRQSAAQAESEARAKGCDPGRINEAIRRGTPPPPPPPSGGGGTGTGGSDSGTGEGDDSGGDNGITCSVMNISLAHAAPGAPLRYLVYRLDPTDPRSPIKRGYGILTVPGYIEQHDEVLCNSGRSCLRALHGEIPYQVLSDHGSRGSAESALKRLCPNPMHRGEW